MKETYSISGINRSRLENDLILYDDKKFHNTNQYGYEVAVLNNIATLKKINIPFDNYDYILSAHGTSCKILEEKGYTNVKNLGVYIY